MWNSTYIGYILLYPEHGNSTRPRCFKQSSSRLVIFSMLDPWHPHLPTSIHSCSDKQLGGEKSCWNFKGNQEVNPSITMFNPCLIHYKPRILGRKLCHLMPLFHGWRWGPGSSAGAGFPNGWSWSGHAATTEGGAGESPLFRWKMI